MIWVAGADGIGSGSVGGSAEGRAGVVVVVGNKVGCKRWGIVVGSLGKSGIGAAVGLDELAEELATAGAEGEGSCFPGEWTVGSQWSQGEGAVGDRWAEEG